MLSHENLTSIHLAKTYLNQVPLVTSAVTYFSKYNLELFLKMQSPSGVFCQKYITVNKKLLGDLQLHQSNINEIVKIQKSKLQLAMHPLQNMKRVLIDNREILFNKIPRFWKVIFLHVGLFYHSQVDYLNYLTSIRVEDIKDGFQIRFVFDVNPFFANLRLTKEFRKKSTEKKLQSLHVPIQWKHKDYCLIIADEARAHESEDDGRENFFIWYNDNDLTSDDPIASFIKQYLWINPLEFYETAVAEMSS